MYTCQFCVANGKSPEELTFNSDLTWLTHLVSEQHFGVQRLLGAKKTFENWDLKRTIVVSGVFGLKAKEIVDFFATFGDVQNFFYVSKEDGKAQFCKVLMADEKLARSIHLIGVHKVKNTSFRVRLQLEAAVKISPIPTDKVSSSGSTPVVSTVSSIGNSPKMAEKFKILYGKPEGGFTKANGFFCRICELKVGFGEEMWVQHLISEQHQKIHRTNQHIRKVLWDLDKKVMVSKAKGVSSEHILRYLVAFGGTVLDFSYLAVKQGGTDVCYALMSTKEEANKLTASDKHCIGPQRMDVRISSITNDEKLKWRNWKSKLLSRIESKTEEKFDESFVMDDEDDVKIEEVNKPDVAADTSKRKNTRSDSKIERSIETFKGLTIAQQLEKFRDEFGWDATFLTNSMKFVDHIISKSNLKPKKVPFGDFTTGLGLNSSPTLQLLVDVQGILEAKTQNSKGSITSMINSCVKSLKTLKAKNNKTFPIKQIRSTESEICVSSTIEGMETNVKLKFSNSLPFVECKLFKFYCDFDVRVFPLSFILSFWASSNNYLQNTKQAYPNQLLIFLIMSYLQHNKVIPTIQKLQESNPEDTKPLLVNGNNLAFCSNVDTISKIHPNPLADMLKNDDSIRGMSVLGLLKDFFQFFASADLKENAICTRFGYFIPKKDFQPDSVGKLPGDLCRVYRFGMSIAEHKQSDILTTKKFLCSQTPLCIQHPFDLSLNCSRAITPNEVLRFQNGCKNTTQVLGDLLTSDEPDFTMFLSKCVPVTAEVSENSCKKFKTEPESITSVTSVPAKKVVPQTITPVPISTQSTKLTSPPSPSVVAHLPVVSSSQPDIHNKINKPNFSISPTKTNSPRASAADFFDNNKPENEPLPMSFESDSTMRDCTITLNKNLFDYFARSFSGTDAMKFEKLQILMFQYILEFNQKFWVNCLGLIFEPKVGQKFWPEEFATIFNEGKSKTDKTVLQKILAITNKEQDLSVTFRVRSDGKLIHKMFVDSPDHNLTSKWCKGTFLTEFSLQLYEEVPDSRLTEIKNSVYAQCNSKSEKQQILLECQLLGAVSTDRNFPTPLVTLNIGAAKYGHERIFALKSLFRTLCMSYVNKMVKRWLAEAKDFNDNKANNFVKGRNQQWTAKANKKIKIQAKQAAKKMQNANYVPMSTPMNNTPRPQFTNPNQQVYRQQFSQRNPQFQSPRLMPLGHGSGYNGTPNQMLPQSSSYSGGRGRMTTPHPDQFQSNTRLPPQYQQQHQPMYNSNDPPPERLLRNPGPQGMRTFYPPQIQPSQPRSVSLLPNPQFNVSHNKPRFISNPCANQDMLNAQLPFQNQDHHGRPITLENTSNSSHQPQPLFLQNPHHKQPTPLFENPNFNYNPAHDEKEKARRDRFEKFVQRGPSNQTPSSPMFTKKDPLPDQIQHSTPKPQPLFESMNVQQPQRYLEQRVPYQNQQRNFLEPIFPSKPRPLFERSPPKPLFGSSNHQYLHNPAAANNSAQMYPRGFRPNHTNRKQREGSRPMNRAFIKGGFLSTERVDSEEEELDIVWELDPKGSSSPPPSPPRKHYKVGAAFPVPPRPRQR